ncbi:MAG: VOC family protein, partial [Myxococcota bacterium]
MPIRGLDHVAITCADPQATMDFYKRVLGATTHFEDLWREGKIPVFLLQVGASRLSVHSAA